MYVRISGECLFRNIIISRVKTVAILIRKNFEKYPVIQSEDIIYVECNEAKV